MACLNCCDDTACCIYSFFYPIPGVRYPLIKTVGVPSIGQCLPIPRGACANGFMVPDSPYVWQGTPKNINCDRAACNDPPCLCCCSGQCFEVPCDDLTACTSVGGVVVESCEGCEEYDESLRGACCSQECDGFHCRRMTECECLSGESAAGRRYTHFAGPGTECEEVSRCCIGGTVNQAIDTEEACTVAGGDWVTGHACDEYPCGSPPCNCFCDEEHPCPSECECVDGQCVPPPIDGECCGWVCDYVAEIIWPDIENPEDIPAIDTPDGWILMPGGVPGIGEYRKTIGEENCDNPDAVAAKVVELQAELDGLVAGQGGHSQVSLDPSISGQGCIPATEQECSDEFAGTWYETLGECFDNCNPLP